MTNGTPQVVVHVPRRFTRAAWGGTERVLSETLPRLAAHGYESLIHTTQALDSTPTGLENGTPVFRHRYLYPEWPLSPETKQRYDQKGGNLVSFPLARALRETEFLTVLHLHTGARLGAQCLSVARERQVPVVMTLHGGHFDMPPEERKSFEPTGAAQRSRRLPWGQALSVWWGTRKLLSSVDTLICVGVGEYEAARKALPEQRIEFIPGGVDVQTFAAGDARRGRELLGAREGRALVVCVARLDAQKSQATLVEAWASLGEANCDLALVGPETTPGYVQEISALPRSSQGKLIVASSLRPEDMADIYAAATISVLPSRHEPFGLTCVESWAAGACLVAANVGGPGWLLRGELEGRLFQAGAAESLAGVLRELLRDPEQRSRLAAQGRERARDYSWEQRAARLAAVYADLLGPGRENTTGRR